MLKRILKWLIPVSILSSIMYIIAGIVVNKTMRDHCVLYHNDYEDDLYDFIEGNESDN